MRILRNRLYINSLLEQLAEVGYLVQKITPTAETLYRWTVSKMRSSDSYLHNDGKRYWGIDLYGMLPLYQEIYQRIYTRRLENWGLAGYDDVGLLYANGLLLIWGPDEFMQAKRPATVALQRIEAADEIWVDWLEQWWQQTALDWENQLDSFWSSLQKGCITVEDLQSVIAGKIKLNAIGVDSLMPSRQQVEAWISPHVALSFLKEVVDGCFLPASGYLAYDILEVEYWRLAESVHAIEELPEAARIQFIQQGLFYLYEALDNTRKDYFFCQYPLETAMKYAQAAPGRKAIRKNIEDVQQRNWQRRFHHEWARQQIETITNSAVHQQLMVLHRLLGTARDFDEEKRRLNMKLWRNLFALADGFNVYLAHSHVNLDHLCSLIQKGHTSMILDPAFRANAT